MKITRAFTRKINLGNYETADFYCEIEGDYNDNPDEYNACQVSGELIEICRQEVENDIQEFLEERDKIKAELFKAQIKLNDTKQSPNTKSAEVSIPQ